MASKGLERGLSKHKYTADTPPTPEDMKLSNQHLRDRIKFNDRHAADHAKMSQEARLTLRKRGIKA